MQRRALVTRQIGVANLIRRVEKLLPVPVLSARCLQLRSEGRAGEISVSPLTCRFANAPYSRPWCSGFLVHVAECSRTSIRLAIDQETRLHHGRLYGAFANLQVSGLTLISTGTPFTAQLKGNAADNTGTGSNFSTRPDQIGTPICRVPAHAAAFLQYAAFALPPALQTAMPGATPSPGLGHS